MTSIYLPTQSIDIKVNNDGTKDEEEKRKHNSKPPVSSPPDIKRQKCIRLGLVPGTNDFQQCMN